MTESAPPPLYPIQLAEVFCASARASRRPLNEGEDPDGQPTITLSHTELDDERLSFRCRLDVSIIARVLDAEIAEVAVTVQGHFVGDEPIDADLHGKFVSYTPIVQLWPYARGYMAGLAAMLGISLPPLPMLNALLVSDAPEASEA